MTPENVRELVEFVNGSNLQVERAVTEWFEKNPVEETVVGLSDDQVTRMCKLLDIEHLEDALKEWLKAQSFSQQFVIDWGVAPRNATYAKISCGFYAEDNFRIGGYGIEVFERSTPKVAVGQVWKFVADGQDFTVSELAAVSVNGSFVDCIGVKNNFGKSCFYALEDFLAKFEGGSRCK